MCQLSGFPVNKYHSYHCFSVSLNILVNKITKAIPKKILSISDNSLKEVKTTGYCIDYLFKHIEKLF